MIKEFYYRFQDLEIKEDDLIPFLGIDSENNENPFSEIIASALNETSGLFQIRGGFKVFDARTDVQKQTFQIENQIFHPSKTVTAQFKNAEKMAVFICTAGQEITSASMQLSNEGDLVKSYIYDALGSVAVDKAMEKIQEELRKEANCMQLDISDWFSPGYCEWNLSEQQQLFKLLPENFCGIKLTSSSLMTPVKSASGFIAIGKGLKQKGYQCHWCTDTTCFYGNFKRRKKK